MYQRYNFRMNVRELDVFWGLVVSIFLIGGAAGSLSASWAANKYGRQVKIFSKFLHALYFAIWRNFL